VRHSKVEIDILHTETDRTDVSARWSNIQRRGNRGHKVQYSIPVVSANTAGMINYERNVQQTVWTTQNTSFRSTRRYAMAGSC